LLLLKNSIEAKRYRNLRLEKEQRKEGQVMLNWSLTFLVVGLIAAVLGFSGLAGAATQIAWILFVIFLVLFLVSLIAGRGRPMT